MDPNDGGMSGMMKKLSLSDHERKGIKIGGSLAAGKRRLEPQAVVKILSDKPAKADALEATLGRIWCPIRGVECKDLGENRFLFTFMQESGRQRALEDGPWMFGKELVIVEEFDGSKTIDEVEFRFIPIWVRIQKMPLGLMNREAGKLIGETIGEVLRVDADENDLAVGEFLRVKVKLDISKPLMRGVTLDVGAGEETKTKWCPLAYEFLPDFCYLCGLIGHVDRYCPDHSLKGATPQFSRALRFIPEKRRFGEDSRGKQSEQRSMLPWRSSRGRGAGGSSSRGSGERRGSDSDSWRKEDNSGGVHETRLGEEKEVTSPLKGAKLSGGSSEAPRKSLVFVEPAEGQEGDRREGKQIVELAKMAVVNDDNTAKNSKKENSGRGRGFKRQPRAPGVGSKSVSAGGPEKKRPREVDLMEVDEENRAKKVGKTGVEVEKFPLKLAEPADRLCENQ